GPDAVPRAAAPAPRAAPAAAVPGSTQSLPLEALGSDRSGGPATERGVTGRDVRPFSMLGVVWDDASAPLDGKVQVRTRAAGTQNWSGWQDLETHNEDHGADPGTREGEATGVHGSTAPLWVGASDGAQVRVQGAALPSGLRLDLVDPGPDEPGGPSGYDPDGPYQDSGAGQGDQTYEPGGPGRQDQQDQQDQPDGMYQPGQDGESGQSTQAGSSKSHSAPRPRIITRKGWGADERIREKRFGYTKSVKVVFVHHSATGNNYTCKQAPSIIRGIYRFHVKSNGWRDIGYNFAVDKCGNIYEGRAGGVAKAVMGAHTLGFNTNSTGIAVLGTYSNTNPSAATTTALAKLSAWKLGLYGGNPKNKVNVTSQGSNKYKKGKKVKLYAVSGHRDGFVTDCPGGRLYSKLGSIRTSAAKYQGR
ncbi:hypothetical protein QR77_13485, partial [Streptomyces sp. 150FB]|uniref:peptidoglycan recognition protein family protein n=1 Tax=Streptomyces sp. 150FB TaxID=1576605 RepID=UPI0005893AAF